MTHHKKVLDVQDLQPECDTQSPQWEESTPESSPLASTHICGTLTHTHTEYINILIINKILSLFKTNRQWVKQYDTPNGVNIYKTFQMKREEEALAFNCW